MHNIHRVNVHEGLGGLVNDLFVVFGDVDCLVFVVVVVARI